MGLNIFTLEKLKINSYSDTARDQRSFLRTFEVMFNPDSISVSHTNNFAESEEINTKGFVQFTGQDPDRLDLNIIMDGTGVAGFGVARLLGPATLSVADQVSEFLTTCYNIEGKIHQPNYLKIQWGNGVVKDFCCYLDSVSIDYSLFDRDGAPLHAVLKTSFVEDRDANKGALIDNKQSPDLSHRRVVKSGDTLPLLSKEIYGSSKYYLRIAEVNHIDDFRNLTPGQEILFPPLAKPSNL